MLNRKTNQTREISVERSQQKNTVNQSNVFVCFSREKNRKKGSLGKRLLQKCQEFPKASQCTKDALMMHICVPGHPF